MNSYSFPKPLFRTFPARRVSAATRPAARTESRSMNKVLGWGVTILAVLLLIWQLVSSEPLLPSVVSAALLALVSTLAGMRIGVNGATAYIRDVQRLNKVLAEQHHELEELNANLLKQITAEEARTTEQHLS
jgi:uncharacterized membrane protein YfbV (UPF0208 family)